MNVPKSVLHLFLAATLVFVNLACPCASASASPVANVTGEGMHAQHQMHGSGAGLDQAQQVDQAQNQCPHEFTDNQCPDCSSALAMSCDESALTMPTSKLLKIEPDDSSVQIASIPPYYLPMPVPISAGSPPQAIAWEIESPVQRHDRQLK